MFLVHTYKKLCQVSHIVVPVERLDHAVQTNSNSAALTALLACSLCALLHALESY